MPRGTLAAALALGTTVVTGVAIPAAPAAPSPYVVYEVVHAKAGGPAKITVWIAEKPGEGTYANSVMLLRPDPKSGAYHISAMSVGVTEVSGDGVRTYGWPAAVPPCTACAAPSTEKIDAMGAAFEPAPRDRLLVAVARGRATVTVDSRYWRVRETTVGFRVVLADHAASTGVVANGTRAEYFTAAGAPAGPYGSTAFGQVPCDVAGAGTATLVAQGDSGGSRTLLCTPGRQVGAFADTQRGRVWSLTGNVVGNSSTALRLLVFDYPKRP
jgi:hypothetical protein